MREPLLRSDPSPQYRDTALKILAGWKTLGHDISRKLWVLKSSSLCAEARRRTRLEDFGDPLIEPALTILVNSLETEADLHPHGRLLMRVHLQELLETRLRLTQAWNEWSEVPEASVIERPIHFHYRDTAKRLHFSTRTTSRRP